MLSNNAHLRIYKVVNQMKIKLHTERHKHLLRTLLFLKALGLAACGSSNKIKNVEESKFVEGSFGNDLIGPLETELWFRSNGGNDRILGSPRDDIIHLGSGKSTVKTYNGDDEIYLSNWGNKLDAGPDNDMLYVELSVSSTIIIDGTNEIIYRENLLSSFNNEIANFENINASESSSNFKVLSTGSMTKIETGIGNDTVAVSSYTADLDGGKGNDTIVFTINSFGETTVINLLEEIYQTQSGSDARALTNFENIQIIGSNDTNLIGDQNDNRISGGDGSDNIVGNSGYDILDGGAGKDFFVFNSSDLSNELDIILDFTAGNVGDVLLFNYESTLSSTGFSFRNVDLTSGGKKTLGTNTDILFLTGSSYLSEVQVVSALNGLNGINEHRMQFQNSEQICLWEHSPSNSLKISIISDSAQDGVFLDTINTIIQLNGMGTEDFAMLNASNFQII